MNMIILVKTGHIWMLVAGVCMNVYSSTDMLSFTSHDSGSAMISCERAQQTTIFSFTSMSWQCYVNDVFMQFGFNIYGIG